MQSYSVTITCTIMASLVPYTLATPNMYTFHNKIYVKFCFVKLQTHFSQDLLFKLLLSVRIFLDMFH